MKINKLKISILVFLILSFIIIYNQKSLSTNFHPLNSDKYKFTKFTPFLDETIENDFNLIYCSGFQHAWNKLCNNIVKDQCKTASHNYFIEKLNKFQPFDSIISDNIYTSDAILSTSDKICSTNSNLFKSYKINKFIDSNYNDNSIILYSILSNHIQFECDFDNICLYPFFNSTPIKAFGIEVKGSKIIHHQLVKQIEILYSRPFNYSYAMHGKLRFPVDSITLPLGFIIKLISKNPNEEIILSTLPTAGNFLNTFNNINNFINKNYNEYLNDKNSNEVFLRLMQEQLFLSKTGIFQIPEIKFNIIKKYNELINQKIINCFNNEIAEAIQIINIDFSMNGKKIPINDYEYISKSRANCGCGYYNDYRVTYPFIIYIRNIKSKLPYFMAFISNTELIAPNEYAKINEQGEIIYCKEDSFDKSEQ